MKISEAEWSHLTSPAVFGKIVVIERYRDAHGERREHYGCNKCKRAVHWMNASLGDPHHCNP